jgi:hypothetical protein
MASGFTNGKEKERLFHKVLEGWQRNRGSSRTAKGGLKTSSQAKCIWTQRTEFIHEYSVTACEMFSRFF